MQHHMKELRNVQDRLNNAIAAAVRTRVYLFGTFPEEADPTPGAPTPTCFDDDLFSTIIQLNKQCDVLENHLQFVINRLDPAEEKGAFNANR